MSTRLSPRAGSAASFQMPTVLLRDVERAGGIVGDAALCDGTEREAAQLARGDAVLLWRELPLLHVAERAGGDDVMGAGAVR